MSYKSTLQKLNGILCYHKYARNTRENIEGTLRKAAINQLEKEYLHNYEPEKILQFPSPENSLQLSCTENEISKVVNISHNWLSHPFVQGFPFSKQDLQFKPIFPLDHFSCGVQVVGVNDGHLLAEAIEKQGLIKTYLLTCQLGVDTKDGTDISKATTRTRFTHVTPDKIKRALSHFLSISRRIALAARKVHPESQEAYEMALNQFTDVQENRTSIILHSAELVEFTSPYFALKVTCSNEEPAELYDFVHHLGVRVRSSAVCRTMSRTAVGPFDMSNSLLIDYIEDSPLSPVIDNIKKCTKIAEAIPLKPSVKDILMIE